MSKAKTKSDQPVTEVSDERALSVSELEQQVAELQAQLQAAQESERRAKADYQNLVRRQQQERAQFVAFATRDLVSDLLQPLDHLSIAAQQLNDQGLNMVITQLWQKLNDHGLQQVELMGKPFDVATMEVAETEGDSTSELVVTRVHRPGYTLNGEVIQFARVVLGSK